MKPKKIFNTTIFCLFVIFLAIYGSSKTGYYEYENKKQKELTEEEIKKFEEDVAKGKNVNINDEVLFEVSPMLVDSKIERKYI